MSNAVLTRSSRSDEFKEVVREHGGLLWRTAGLYEYDAERRRDLHQEILLAVWSALPKFSGQSSLRTYLARVAHNKGTSHASREARNPRQVVLDEALACTARGPEQTASRIARQAKLLTEIRRFPLLLQQILTLTLEGFKPREIAEVLGMTANAVSIRLTRAKAALKTTMKEYL